MSPKVKIDNKLNQSHQNRSMSCGEDEHFYMNKYLEKDEKKSITYEFTP